MGPPHEGSFRRPIAPWANALTTELYIAPVQPEAARLIAIEANPPKKNPKKPQKNQKQTKTHKKTHINFMSSFFVHFYLIQNYNTKPVGN